MKLDGRLIADTILDNLQKTVAELKKKDIIPTLAVIQVGDDPASTAYIRQKQKAADQIGAMLIHKKLPENCSAQSINVTIQQCNNDPSVHGIILQRPLPTPLNAQSISLCSAILSSKDVDGFLPNSAYPVPVAAAVEKILETMHQFENPAEDQKKFYEWLKSKKVVVLGRGDTAGKPIAEALIKRGSNVTIVHSQTPHPDDVIRAADIVISCVGRPNVVRRDNIKIGSILLSVGLWRNGEGRLHGDYEEDEVKDVASYFMPTPGGVGPVNVAALMTNLVSAASLL